MLDGVIRQGNSQNEYFKLKRRMSKLKCKNSRNMFCISSFLYFFVICFSMGYCIHLFVDKFLYVNTDETFQNSKIRNAYKCFIFMYYIQFMIWKYIDFAIDFACDMVIMIYLVCRTKFNIFTDEFHQNQHLLMLGLILFKMPQRT